MKNLLSLIYILGGLILFESCSANEKNQLKEDLFINVTSSVEFKENQTLIQEISQFTLQNPGYLKEYPKELGQLCPDFAESMPLEEYCTGLKNNKCLHGSDKLKYIIDLNCKIVNNNFAIMKKYGLEKDEYVNLIRTYHETKNNI